MVFFFSFERLGRMHENKNIFLKKPGILIPDLYLYDIKIQIDINQNGIENYAGKSQFLQKYIFFFKMELGRTRPNYVSWACIGPATRLDPAQPCG